MTEYKHYYTIETPVSPQLVADMMVTAVEGGANYWVRDFLLRTRKSEAKPGEIWYADPHMYEDDFVIDVTISEEDGSPGDKHIIELNTIQRGLEKMAEKAPTHFNNMISGDFDAETADVFLQFVVLGEITYG